MTVTKIDINPQFKKALELLENGTNHLFITGRAGTGKSTLLKYFRDTTDKKVVVLAPTGVAAINIDGETIHSFFKIKPAIGYSEAKKEGETRLKSEKAAIYKNIDLIIIDEISMVRADLLDCVDIFLQTVKKSKKPFGGTRFAYFGDLYQLPPVTKNDEIQDIQQLYKSPYFFNSKVVETLMNQTPVALDFIELETIYRQKEKQYIDLLNIIRDKTITDKELDLLNERIITDPKELINTSNAIILTTTNKKAEELNQKHLQKIKHKEVMFQAQISGTFDRSYYPTDELLKIKVGARIMMVYNDPEGEYVNGTLGTIKAINEATQEVTITLDNKVTVTVTPNKWQLSKSAFDITTKRIERETIGTFIQMPFKLAWAITIHKSQGKTFDNVIIDLDKAAFAAGQTYVALSRCTTFKGLKLARPLRITDIRLNKSILKFLTSLQYKLAHQQEPLDTIKNILTEAINSESKVKIIYLKSGNIKSERIIEPHYIEEMEYQGYTFTGLSGYCHKAQEIRTFNVERILEIMPID